VAGAGLSKASPAVQIYQALLTNTLEQATLGALASAAFAALAPPRALPLVAAHALLFSAGRALFAAGYSRGAGARSSGFALTFYPTAAMLAASLYWLAVNPW
jgi:hypothetical protein